MTRTMPEPQSQKAINTFAGFSFTETLVAASLGCILATGMLSVFAPQLKRMNRENDLIRTYKAEDWARLAINRIKKDIEAADQISNNPSLEVHGCSLGTRLPVLHLRDSKGQSITYSVGAAPTTVWRSPVLMRCAAPTNGAEPENHVMIDGLAKSASTWSGCKNLLPFLPGGDLDPGIDLSASSKQAFSACRQTNGKAVAIRLVLESKQDQPDEDLIPGSL